MDEYDEEGQNNGPQNTLHNVGYPLVRGVADKRRQ